MTQQLTANSPASGSNLIEPIRDREGANIIAQRNLPREAQDRDLLRTISKVRHG